MMNEVVSVSQMNFYIKSLFEGDSNLNDVLITGEIANFKSHFASGHLYFSLKDENASMRCVMFKGFAKNLKFSPENGTDVLVRGNITIYEASGQYQILVRDMQPLGEGILNLEFLQTKEKLLKEGLFDDKYKKSLPRLPKKIGVVTSKTGAVIEDIKNVLARRYPLCEIILSPATVQGSEAVNSIINAMDLLNKQNQAQVIIIARGGGSNEDLAPFNDEKLARAIFNNSIPIISAVGHETDFTICDFVSDLRAPTPSAAAELVSPNIDELYSKLMDFDLLLDNTINNKISNLKMKLDILLSSKTFSTPIYRVLDYQSELKLLTQKLNYDYINKYNKFNNKFLNTTAKLNSLAPRKVMKRGYAIVQKQNQVISSISSINLGDNIDISLLDGNISCVVKQIDKEQ